MGFLNNYKNKSSLQKPDGWIALKSLSQLDSISTDSHNHTIAIFKHSTSCGISLSVIDKLSQQWAKKSSKNPIYFLDLLSYRDVSNEIAKKFDVIHQSPQILLIKNGESIFSASHHAIDLDKFDDLITDNLDQIS